MMNFKQKELLEKLLQDIQAQFPEVEYLYTTPSPESRDEIWIHVTAPEDEDRELELIHFSGDKAMDILLDYGYPMLVLPVSKANGTKSESNPPRPDGARVWAHLTAPAITCSPPTPSPRD